MKKAFFKTGLVVSAIAVGCSDTTGPVIEIEPPVEDVVPTIVQWPSSGSIRFSATGAGAVGAMVRREYGAPGDTTILYLSDSILPTGTLTPEAPSGWWLPNYDPARDTHLGLTLVKSDEGVVAEQDEDQFHQFVANGPFQLSGQAQFSFWSVLPDTDNTLRGAVEVGLFECATDITNCRTISLASKSDSAWDAGSFGFKKHTVDFGLLTDSIASDKLLVLKLVVADSSEDDMWLAYGTTFQPSKLIFGGAISELEPDEIEWSFFAKRGEERIMELGYVDDSGSGDVLPFFSLDASQPTNRPDGSPILAGDSIQITVTVDTTEMIVYLEPTGLQFDSTATPLQLWYGGVGGDLNGDGFIDNLDSQIESQLGIWYQVDVSQPWERLQSERSTSEGWVRVGLKHFSNYAVAW